MDGERIIPTRYRTKIPRNMSYPIGAKRSQRGSRRSPIAMGVHAVCEIIQAQFAGSGGFFHPDGGGQSRVGAVPRPLRHLIQGKLVAERDGRPPLTIMFDEPKEELIFEDYSSLGFQTARSN